MERKSPLVIADLRGGRNGTDPPHSLPENQCVEALNVDWYDGLLARKRNGATAVTDTGGTAFSSGMQSLFRHIPGADETAAEFWGIDGAATPIVKRMTGGTSFANVTLADAIATSPQKVVGATLNGKLFLAYDSTSDRLHVYDPQLGSPKVRRVGFATPAAPTAADSAVGGSYAAVLRYYRVRWLQLNGTLVVRRSEAGASVSFTPNGSFDAAVVTRPTAASEDETHWEVEASTDNTTFYRLAQVAIGTTTYSDSALTTTYSSNTESAVAGHHSAPTSWQYLMTDGNRLIGAGAWETSGAKYSRVWFTPVLGSTDRGDDERIPNQTDQKNWVDLNENDGGFVTGMGGPVNGNVIVFKYRQTYKLVATGDSNTPYLPRRISDQIGCVSHKSICLAEDEAGRPALYFLSHKGPYRLGSGGLQYLGRDNEDVWSAVNLGATSVVAHTASHTDRHQVWFHVATGSSNDPDTRMVFDTLLGIPNGSSRVRGGWSKHTGDAPSARCSVMMSNTLAAAMSRDLKPYIGRATGTAIWKADSSATNDAGTTFAASVKTKPLGVAPLGVNAGIGQSHLLAKAASGVTITQTIDRDFGLETRTATVLLTAAGSETRVLRKIEGSDLSGCGTIQIQIGDGSAASNGWTLDALSIPVDVQEPR